MFFLLSTLSSSFDHVVAVPMLLCSIPAWSSWMVVFFGGCRSGATRDFLSFLRVLKAGCLSILVMWRPLVGSPARRLRSLFRIFSVLRGALLEMLVGCVYGASLVANVGERRRTWLTYLFWNKRETLVCVYSGSMGVAKSALNAINLSE